MHAEGNGAMRIAMLGVGHWHAGMHADAARAAGAVLGPVWDADPDVATRFAAREGGHAVPTVAAALAQRPDFAVALGTGPGSAALVAQLLKHDLPLLVDKPLGLSAPEVIRLAAQAAKLGRFVAVPLANRTSPILEQIATRRAAGSLGDITNMQYRLINGPAQRYRDWGVGWMLDPAFSGGGALRNLGVHGLDAFAAIAGDQHIRVEHAAFRRSGQYAGVEEYALVVLRAADGMIGVVEAGYTHADPRGGDYEWRVDAPSVSLADDGEALQVATTDAAPQKLSTVAKGGRYRAFMADTLARCADGRPPLVSLDDFARASELADAAYAMAG